MFTILQTNANKLQPYWSVLTEYVFKNLLVLGKIVKCKDIVIVSQKSYSAHSDINDVYISNKVLKLFTILYENRLLQEYCNVKMEKGPSETAILE